MSVAKGVVPYFLSPNCPKHVEWMKTVFGAEQGAIYYADDAKTKVSHCSVNINNGVIYLSDYGSLPGREEDQPVQNECRGVMIQVDLSEEKDVDEIWKKAVENEAKVNMELKVQSWGDYYGTFFDPWGYEWALWSLVKKSDVCEQDVAKTECSTEQEPPE